MWVNPYENGVNWVGRIQWPKDITAKLVCFDNPKGTITNSDLDLSALVLQQ